MDKKLNYFYTPLGKLVQWVLPRVRFATLGKPKCYYLRCPWWRCNRVRVGYPPYNYVVLLLLRLQPQRYYPCPCETGPKYYN